MEIEARRQKAEAYWREKERGWDPWDIVTWIISFIISAPLVIYTLRFFGFLGG